MCVYIYIYIYTHKHTYIHTYTHILATYILAHKYCNIYWHVACGMWQIIKQNAFHGVAAPSGSPTPVKHSSMLNFVMEHPSPCPSS